MLRLCFNEEWEESVRVTVREWVWRRQWLDVGGKVGEDERVSVEQLGRGALLAEEEN